MKKIIFVLMLLFSVTILNAQTNPYLRIGNIKLRDSSGTLVVTSPLLSWSPHWITLASLPTNIVGSGLYLDPTTGINLKIGTGLVVQNDTLKYNGNNTVTVDDSTIYFSNGKLRVKFNTGYGFKTDLNGLYLNLDATNLQFGTGGILQLKPNSITNAQISKDLNLDSMKIGGALMKFTDGKVDLGDSIVVRKINVGDNLLIGRNYISALDTVSQMYFYFDGSHNIVRVGNSTSAIIFDQSIGNFEANQITVKKRLLGNMGSALTDGSDTLTFGDGNFFVVNRAGVGATTITDFNPTGWTAGSIVTIQLGGRININNGTNLILLKRANITGNVNEIYTFIFDGTAWRELSRTAN